MNADHVRAELLHGMLLLGALALTLGTALQVMVYMDEQRRSAQPTFTSTGGMLKAMFASGMATFVPAAGDVAGQQAPAAGRAARSQKLPVRARLGVLAATASIALPRWILRRLIAVRVERPAPGVDEQAASRTLAGWCWLFFGALLSLMATFLDWFLGLSGSAAWIMLLVMATAALVPDRWIRWLPQARLLVLLAATLVLSLFPA